MEEPTVTPGVASAYVEIEIHDENGPISGRDLVSGRTYSARVFVRKVRPGSVYIGKRLAFAMYSSESIFLPLGDMKAEFVVKKTDKSRAGTFAKFDFRVGEGEGILILYLDVFLGYKLLTRVTTVKKVVSGK